METIRIGNASGYWGDDPDALRRQVEGGELDYVTMDFLAEVTMSILKKQQQKKPQLGYAADFVDMLAPVAATLIEKKVCVISNAGGMNPLGCAQAVHEMALQQGLNLRVAVVHGDDFQDKVGDLVAMGNPLRNMDTGESVVEVLPCIQSANVYFGARAVVKALESCDPHVVITGRVTDTGITLAPMVHRLGWSWQDWDKLAAGIVAGHLIECGCQVTGGNFTDWKKVRSYANMGYPIIEMNVEGRFWVTKHPSTGGLVSVDTVREQLFYEMGNPDAYLTPDVTVDFSTVSVREDGVDRVLVEGVSGMEPTPFYKVSMAYEDGYKIHSSILVSGPHATEKAQAFAQIFWQRWSVDLQETATEYLGWNACHGSLVQNSYSSEVVLRLSARDSSLDKLKLFSRQVASLILSGPPGVTILSPTGKPTAVVSYWPALLDKRHVKPQVSYIADSTVHVGEVEGATRGHYDPYTVVERATSAEVPQTELLSPGVEEGLFLPLGALCLARSGDKGDSVNIGLLARCADAYSFIRESITAAWVKTIFRDLCDGKVTRYELTQLRGLNFILENALGGGGSCTLQADAQGKTFSQAILSQPVVVSPLLYQRYVDFQSEFDEGAGQ
ncbi:MAG: DUF1446 domain-containing protein [Zetaproteobacteria bacterium]|nr:DUF1446 domain-containing protein [Zetaproteobacteria bacterium]